ncbi:MAG: chitobiase/beta-hexosaminidase C-terminal domain-containing protein [Bacteroidaceae bacterium]|nr:chitobiase/beta-hexosaminidase C-terminal domain-containing protein [Bacteroidaceae bacterium]
MTILNYNSSKSNSHLNPGRHYPSLENKFSQTKAHKFIYSKFTFRSLLVALMMVCNFVGAWAQITPTTDTNSNGTYEDNEKHLYLIQSKKIESFYLVANGDNVNTVNLPHADMLWYFIEAENDNGTQYYYIVNNATGKYICNSDYSSPNRTIKLATFEADNTDKFKFKLVENNYGGTTGYYNIDIKPNGSGWLGLNKQSGQVESTYPVRLTNDAFINDDNSRWKFIAFDNNFSWPAPPFTLSPGDTKTYYRIRNQQNTNYFISTGSGTPTSVTISNIADNKMAWYFKEAATDDSGMKCKYYYIINPTSGNQYMYFNGNIVTSDQSNAIELKEKTSENEDRYQFLVIQAARVGAGETPIECYMIVPKLLLGNLWSSNSIGPGGFSDGNKMQIKKGRGKDVNTHWTFATTEYPLHCATPTITYDSSTGKVTITATSPVGASIYYTTDGTTVPTSSDGTQYSAAFTITEQTTIKAVASKDGYEDSEVATATFNKVATPTIQDNGSNAISISCETTGTTIYYTTDGSNPTTSSSEYTGPLSEGVSGQTIKAIAVKNGWINSEIGSGSVTLRCAKPTFTRNGNNVTISCAFPTSGYSIYYIKNGGDAEPNTLYEGGNISVTTGDVIKAYVTADGYYNSEVATKKIFDPLPITDGKYILDTQEKFENFIDMASTEDYDDAYYELMTDVTAGSEISIPFKGTFDGKGHTISSLSHALFNTIDGATVKNVMLENVDIDTYGNSGAIANEATGDSRIYNVGVLSGAVDGNDNVGGIVGFLDGSSRVINCFSYATIEGGSNVGGIVGNNNVASTAANIKTMVMNCMFYGDITGGSTVSPVYGGKNINNLNSGGLNTYNYYAYENLKSTSITPDKYNCALGVEDRFLQRIEFYRQLLNSNKRLAAKYASTGSVTVDATEMMKWVLETADRSITSRDPYPYPILKAQGKYPSIVNYDTRNLANYSEAERNKGLKTGTLDVTINQGSNAPGGATITNGSLTLTRTDKDFKHFNFNYDKVQLPYYNEVGTGNYTSNKVVTGWKIISMTGGTTGSYSATDAWGGYNFANRECTAKDLYGTSGRVFSQGAYFDVPYGVTGITIEPYWGEAAYVSDEYLDVVFSTAYGAQNVEALGKPFGANGVEATINGSTQKVYSSIGNAVDALSTGGTVYDHAVVLVGNVHLAGNPPTADKSYTIMSADLDKDNEPDCSFIFGHNDRQAISPVRFDFINMPGIAMAQKPNGAGTFRNVSIFKPKGWFETTNTCLVHFVQFEYDNGGKSAAPVIIQGGLIDQFVSTKTSEPKVTQYIHLGGNVWFKDFGNGTHSDGDKFTPHIPISVTGGEYEGFYLSGTYRPDATVKADDAECYISSGYFGEVAGAAQQQINGNVKWQIYNADIDNFFGGGINFNKPVTGNITIDITNSHVGTFCGGPKFGDMAANKTVTTNATGCTFDTYFGAGYGGISYNRVRTRDKSGTDVDLSSWQSDYTGTKGKYNSGNKGVATDFDYEFFVWSTGVVGARFYVKYSSLSMAKTNDVSSTLKNCIINRNFYGGGNLGKVDGTATSILEGCTVEGNVFGGGYSATKPKVPFRTGGFSEFPKIDANAGVFDMGKMSETDDYTLIQGTLTNNTFAINESAKTIVTDIDLTSLGQVTTTNLTIKGNTIVKGQIFGENGNVTETTGGVFGGGDMSAVNGNTLVNIEDTDDTEGVLNVFGGGNTADVGGNTEVNVIDGKVSLDVFGGGKGQNTTVNGDVTVNIGAKDGSTLSGDGVIGNVYGGSAFGAVNATKGANYAVNNDDISATEDKNTVVNIYGGTVTDNIYGGGLGQKAPTSIAARSFGNVTVNIEGGSVGKTVYGGSNENGVLKKKSTITITGGTVGTVANPISDAVFGGGFGEPTLVEGDVEVNIGTSGQESVGATINGNIYGGGALGNVNTSKPASELVFDATKKVDVNLYKGTINGNVFGGGLGQKNGENGAESDILSYVGGDVNVLLDGAKIPGSIFGCNNLNGTPKGHVKVWVKRTVDSDKSSVEALAKTREQRTTYDVAAVYGGGNKADYIPTNALIVLPDKNAEDYDDKLTKLNAARTEVIIEGCEETSINYVYGGGNAAAVPATEVTIKGTYIINNVYGGGNGSGDNNPGANVGIINPTAYAANHENGTYGTGKAVTRLLGGYINNVYGGSNTKGDIVGGTDVRTKQRTDIFTKPEYCTDLNVGKIFGAGSHADMDGDVNIILECMPEDYVKEVYGGAEQATVNGNVSLIVTSGKFGRVFGGNNAGGDIRGSITVNVSEDGCKPLIIGELYGGGNQAPYSIYGCTQSGGTWTANTEGTAYTGRDPAIRADVEVYVFSCTSIGRIFGGGNQAEVIGNTRVWVNTWKGYINGVLQDNIGKIGQVFGGGNAAKVTGNTLVDVGTALANEGEDIGVNITRGTYTDASHGTYISPTINEYINLEEAGIYGGGYSADVDGNATLNIGTKNQNMGINIAGNIFGGGFGETTHVTGDVTVNIGANIGTNESPNYVGFANITGDVYGGSAKGKVNSHLVSSVETATEGKETQVNLYGGTINGNLYGGGLGDGSHAADVYGPVTVNVENGSVNNVFGCNNTNGTPKSTVAVNIDGGAISQSVYGGGNQAIMDGSPVVNVTGGTIGTPGEGGAVYGNVYGGGLGSDGTGSQTYLEKVKAGLVKGDTEINISGGTILHNIYGGGAYGSVGDFTYNESTGIITGYTSNGKATISITGGTIGTTGKENGMVFGSSRGDVGEPDGIHDKLAWVYDTEVNIGTQNDATEGPAIKGSVYGGGENGHTYHDAEVKIYSGTIGINTGEDVEYRDGENNITYSGKDYNYPYRGNVYGAGCGTDKYDNNTKYNLKSGGVGHDTRVTIYGGQVVGNVYGAGAMGSVNGSTTVTISGGTIGVNGSDYGNVYAAARGEVGLSNPNYASVTNTTLNISGGEIKGSAFGGGQAGIVKGNVAVNVSGGKVINDVYGGGALSNTNTANWAFGALTPVYIEVTGLTYPEYKVKDVTVGTTVVTGLYERTGTEGSYSYTLVETANQKAESDKTYCEFIHGSSVKDLYTESGGNYTKITEATEAVSGTKYYEERQLPGTWADGKSSSDNTTTIKLTGGVIGNVYGGGLGDPTHPVYVCGDVIVNVNNPADVISDEIGVGFTNRADEHITIEGDDKEYVVPITGRVFGCNNIKGTPLGDVHVNVYSTRKLDESGNVVAHVDASSHTTYEIQAVYGGGNQADYVPAKDKGTHVMIDGCQATTIKKVYGGGSSASVPATDVLIKAAIEIGFAFGGGNGGEKVYDYSTGEWKDNNGARVNGLSKIVCQGGKIGQIFGGSDSKGDCRSVSVAQNPGGTCPLIITRMYGAGNEADVTGNVDITISGCTEGNTEIEYVCGGSYNAHITGSINLTITAGFFKSVYGGNESSGGIGGNITVNIEETDECKPIIIENLVGGGNMAPFPGTDKDGNVISGTGKKITVNVKSATRIDNIYGGGYESEVNGDTEVNINMTKGIYAGRTYTPTSTTYPDALGIIGNVFGGGNSGRVRGNTTVNIGTETSVGYVTEPKQFRADPAVPLTPTDGLYVVAVAGANITGNVFGGGNKADVTGNSNVNICTKDVTYNSLTEDIEYTSVDFSEVSYPTGASYEGVKIGGSVYGGGNMGSVGTFDHLNTAQPTSVTSGGTCTVTIGGDAVVGPASMPANFLSAYTKVSATKGVVEDFMDERFIGHVFGGCKGNNNIETDANVEYKSWANKTYVTIGNKAFVKGSVYGGAENGHILNNTNVFIRGGQIGCGAGQTAPYEDAQFIATPANVTDGTKLAECPHWEFGRQDSGDTEKQYLPYDPFATNTTVDARPKGSDGHTYYGNVFGGGSGAFPYAAGKWLYTAGAVYGSTKVTITGGHILTSIYGGNEMTDVLGDSCVVIMKGGTLGVPRTLDQIAAHPVTCYLFGSGKGDQRTLFNTKTNVNNVRVHVGGTARIYGSVFGGGEDGHVLENVKLGIFGGTIGTTGTSYVDGNVFGGGRGFSGDALTAGSVGGNIGITIEGGTMLGSVYGGGRLASVGIDFTAPNDPTYGQFKPDETGVGAKTYGHITIDISGGTIGNDIEDILVEHTKGGNVFGGSMGRLTRLNGTPNPLWPRLAEVKTSTVNISGTAVIKGNVYGGSEFGTIYNDATVSIEGGTIWRDVFGGGYGSDINTEDYRAVVEAGSSSFSFTPMQFAGSVAGHTYVNISGGWVKKNVYGGGEIASVGIIDFVTTETKKHTDVANSFALSWPFDYTYIEGLPGGTSHVEVTGGRVGITGKDYMGPFNESWVPIDKEDGHTLSDSEIKDARIDNGDIYGGSKGVAGDRYNMAYCANVRNTSVTVNYSSNTATTTNYKDKTGSTYPTYNYTYPCIAGSVYGGGENGHVVENASVTLEEGLIGHAIYGGGKGKDTYTKTLKKIGSNENYDAQIYSLTAGKVFGNTSVTMNGGTVVRNIYGGGNMASVGKGNYASGEDDYYPAGYGEKISGNLWDNVSDNSKAFLASGKTTVLITGGTVGTPNGEKDNLPYGNVYGGCRGEAAPNIFDSPRYEYCPAFFAGYVNETDITIGTEGSGSGPAILGSVYGGGQDGHVRRDTHVTINSGTIGLEHTSANITAVGAKDEENNPVDMNHFKWMLRGNVYGAGSGIGQYKYDLNYDGTNKDAGGNVETVSYHNPLTGATETIKEIDYSNSAGSVTRFSIVDIKGGTIYRNVYGGGSLANAGAPRLTQNYDPYRKGDTAEGHGAGKQAMNEVNISGGTIGTSTDNEAGYGGDVFGAGRGQEGVDKTQFATSNWTVVNIKPNATPANNPVIAGNVYGGGEMGIVRQNTEVNMLGGTITHDAYGGGKGTDAVEADVNGDVTVELNNNNNGDVADGTKTGCVVDRIFGCNDYNGTPKGHVKVHIFATQNGSQPRIGTKFGKRPAQGEPDHEDETIVAYLKRLIVAAGKEGVPAKVTASVITAANTTLTENEEKTTLEKADSTAINTAIANVQNELCNLYDVKAVYGGGDLAAYNPTNATSSDQALRNASRPEVIIDGCGLTSIRQVYGGGNAASTPATYVRVNGTYEIDEVFGGGNGKDDYQMNDGKWYQNPGANVGYRSYTHYDKGQGTGDQATPYLALDNADAGTKEQRQAYYRYGSGYATTEVVGGHVHMVYGGSNQKGNISTMALSVYQESGTCDLIYDKTYGAGKNADIDGEARVTLDCVAKGGQLFGGSTNADVNSDVMLNITNGTFTQVFGGNDTGGLIRGSITVNVIEQGCKPIIIDELYGGGYLANYSIYGYYNAGTKESPNYQPRTKEKYVTDSLAVIGRVVYPDGATDEVKAQIRKDSLILAGLYGLPYASPIVNVISATSIGAIYGGGYKATVVGSPHINVNMEKGKVISKYATKDAEAFSVGEHTDATGDKYIVDSHSTEGDAMLAIGKIGDVFGGGNEADIIGNTYVNIGTGKGYDLDGTVNNDLTRNAAFITGSVYGGGKMGHVGNFTLTAGKPSSCAAGTGECHVTISNGEIGPNDMTMYHLDNDGNFKENDAPDNFGHVFGGGQGTNLPADANKAFVDSTEVIINGTAWVKGSVFGGGENGHVLHDTGVKIGGNCQIGNGHILLTKVSDDEDNGTILVNQGVNRRYTDAEWAAGHLILGDDDLTGVSTDNKALVTAQYANSLPECDSWLYGKTISANKVISSSGVYAPHDMFANQTGELEQYPTIPTGESTKTTKGGRYIASDGRAFNGSVYGGGSGYFPYEAGKWLATAGNVEGDTWVEVTGGHILTSLFGGCEMTTVKGDTHVKMTGGTLGVPRTLDEIAAHPVTCYVFGGGKGEERTFLDGITNVEKDAYVTIGGDAWVYGSVFGGAEDGWVDGNVHLKVLNGTKKTVGGKEIQFPLIGTWGTSYVDGNIFGGGRGFGGTNALAGRVGGNVNVNISGGTMLGSVFGGGRLGSVGINDSDGEMQTGDTHGVVTVNISGGTIGNDYEYIYNPSEELRNTILKQTEFEDLTFKEKMADGESETTVKESDETVTIKKIYHSKGGNIFGGGMGRLTLINGNINPIWNKLGHTKKSIINVSGGTVKNSVYGGGEFGQVKGNTSITFTGGSVGSEIKKDNVPQYTFGSIFGGGYGSDRALTDDETDAGIAAPLDYAGLVTGNATINMSAGKVKASVYGGGKLAQVGGNTNITISGGEVGLNKVRKGDGNVMYGGSTMGNVYGGGRGVASYPLSGTVKGNTTINVTGGNIYHNVYGGGAVASVGTFIFSDGVTNTGKYAYMQTVPKGIPLEWEENTGIATVNITGGTIGISGRDNGMVNGSSRGDIALPVPTVFRYKSYRLRT